MQRAVRAALKWKPQAGSPGTASGTARGHAGAAGVRGRDQPARQERRPSAYPTDDAIYPNGEKKDRATIVRFMETEVMPWARAALGPIKGGR